MASMMASRSSSRTRICCAQVCACALSTSNRDMSPPLFIALRFIRHRRRAILISLAGIALGVAFFICTQAQTQGFEQFYIQTVLGTGGAVMVQDRFQTRYSGILESNASNVVSVTGQKPRKYYP